jgi:hypothetical protein
LHRERSQLAELVNKPTGTCAFNTGADPLFRPGREAQSYKRRSFLTA